MSARGETDSEAVVERALRALQVSGRRLFRQSSGRWGVQSGRDRRRRPFVTLAPESVKQLVACGRLVVADEETFVLPGAGAPQAKPAPPHAMFVAANARRPGRLGGGIGFAGLAMMARKGVGPLSLHHVQAGLRLATDAERAAANPRVTMDWDAGPATRQRRAGRSGGRTGDALLAARQLARLGRRMGETWWPMAWMLCVDAAPLLAIKQRFGIGQRDIHAQVAEALERLAAAYDA